MYEQMDIFDFIEAPNLTTQAEIPFQTQFEQLFEKVRDPVFLCANCLCEYCVNNAEQSTDKVKAGEMQKPCFNCDECRAYDGDSRKLNQRKEECVEFVMSDYGARRNRKRIRPVKNRRCLWENQGGEKTIIMIDANESKRFKAKQLRYKKPIVKNLNLVSIKTDLWDMQEDCEEVRWYVDSEDGEDSLINALDGDEDEAYEFRMAFADLCAECERMFEDLHKEWVPECFDIFFVAIGAGSYDELLGWDPYEQDYYGLGFDACCAEDEAKKKLKQLTKDNLILAARQCFSVYHAYMGLRSRYDSLKAAIDILKNQNTGYLQAVKEIERLYEEASKDELSRYEYSKASIEWKQYTDALPQEAWIM